MSTTPDTNKKSQTRTGSRWAIVLAGGEGRRLRSLIRDWLGESRPKQYCTFIGSRSMLQHTLDRAKTLVDPSNIVTVIGSGHRQYLERSINGEMPGLLIEQPIDRGTAAGIYLAASSIFERDPLATVLVLPSDSYLNPEDGFTSYAMHAMALAEKYDDQLFLMGVPPKGAETEYGWIQTAQNKKRYIAGRNVGEAHAISSFHEKPSVSKASTLFKNGCLWNTGIFSVKIKTLWWFGWCALPDMMRRFETFRQVYPVSLEGTISRAHEGIVLTHLYHGMTYADFMRDILSSASDWSSVLPMEGVDWSDWGRPERIRQTLEARGVSSSFLEFYEKTQCAQVVSL